MSDKVEILGEIRAVETIATGASVRIRAQLRKAYGSGRWRKRKGVAQVRLVDGFVGWAQRRWYEAHGTGWVDIKIKRMLSGPP